MIEKLEGYRKVTLTSDRGLNLKVMHVDDVAEIGEKLNEVIDYLNGKGGREHMAKKVSEKQKAARAKFTKMVKAKGKKKGKK